MSGVVVEQTRILTVPLTLIRPAPDQPRLVFDEDALGELASSIREHGQQVAIIVRELVGDERGGHAYEIIDGERRFRACHMLESKTIRCELRGAKDRDHQFVQSVVSNFGRREHTAMESALACARIFAMPEYAALPMVRRLDRVGALFARSGQWVKGMLQLAKLPESVQAHLGAGRLNAQVAQFLCAVKDPQEQSALADTIVTSELKPPMARNLIRDSLAKSGRALGRPGKPSDTTRVIEAQLGKIAEIATTLVETPRRGMSDALTRRPTLQSTMLASIDKALEVLTELRKGVVEFASRRSA